MGQFNHNSLEWRSQGQNVPSLEMTTRKSIWRSRHSQVWSFLCPLCGIQRKVPFRSQPGGSLQIFRVLLTSIIFMLCTWPWFTWKGIVSFLPFWSVFEVIYRWRMRSALNCQQCGFDPYLFLIDENWCRKEVEAHWRQVCETKGIPYQTRQSLAQRGRVNPSTPKVGPISGSS